MAPTFTIGDRVRYKPGNGTYGHEESVQADGSIPGVVVGFTRKRVRVRLHRILAGMPSTLERAVDAASLTVEA